MIIFDYEEVSSNVVPAHHVALRALTAGGGNVLNSNDYMVRCTSMLSACEPEYFMLSSKGEMIHGKGDSPADSEEIIWKSKSKGEGEYMLSYEENRYVTITRKGIIPKITDMLDVLGGEEVEEEDDSIASWWSDFLEIVVRDDAGGEEEEEAVKDKKDGRPGGIVKKLRGAAGKAKNVLVFVADKAGIMKDRTKNRRVLRKQVKKLPHLTPWPCL